MAQDETPSASDSGKSADSSAFKCAQCAATLEYKPGADVQQCPYCGHENPIPKSEADIKELDYATCLSRLAQDEPQQERLTIECQDCAARTFTDANVVAQECPFCGSHMISTRQSTKAVKPRALLPFNIADQRARELFRKWLTELWFAPNALRRLARQDSKLVGMYVPYWTYDSDATSFYRGQRGDHYWVTEHYTAHENGKAVRKDTTGS